VIVGRGSQHFLQLIFGASGELTKRKLIPALYNLAMDGLLPKEFAIVGCARRSQSDEGFRDQLTKDLQTTADCAVDAKLWAWFLERIHYVQCDVQDAAGFQRLSAKLAEVEKQNGTQVNRVFYLAIAPQFFADIVRQLSNVGLIVEGNRNYARVVLRSRLAAMFNQRAS
jgi:glucose-6-phosphate 1-dehydrogenase